MGRCLMTQDAKLDPAPRYVDWCTHCDQRVYRRPLDQAIANSPPPLGDVGDDVTHMMDEGMGMLKGDELVDAQFPLENPAVADIFQKDTKANPKQAYGDKKLPLHRVPPALMLYAAMGLKNGAKKYGPFNWREKNIEALTYYSAALRHLFAWFDGQDNDPDSGNPHLAHAIASLAILVDVIENFGVIDNRPSEGPAGDILMYEQV